MFIITLLWREPNRDVTDRQLHRSLCFDTVSLGMGADNFQSGDDRSALVIH